MTTTAKQDNLTLLVTRPTVAAELTKSGHTPQLMPHPWKQGLTAWAFDLDAETTADAWQIYSAMGLSIPKALAKAIEQYFPATEQDKEVIKPLIESMRALEHGELTNYAASLLLDIREKCKGIECGNSVLGETLKKYATQLDAYAERTAEK